MDQNLREALSRGLKRKNSSTHLDQDDLPESKITHADKPLLSKRIDTLYDREEFSDVIIIADDVRIRCHRAILACWSDYFRAMFLSGMRETNMKEIILQDVNPTIVTLVLRYIYSGEIEITSTTVIHIMDLALRWQLDSLAKACSLFLSNSVDPATCCTLLLQNSLAFPTELLHSIASIRFDDLIKVPHFLELPEMIIMKLLESDALNTSSEINVFKAAMDWYDHQITNRISNWSAVEEIEVLTRLLERIRFGTIPARQLSHIKSCACPQYKLAHKSPIFDKLLLDAFVAQFDPELKVKQTLRVKLISFSRAR
eukprot:TRINITY_DN12754_c0_g1::TRINITY_DN12754_c0_g1_i1::g.28718::m.28718 TRINITY_DN12754_c0_g1::TRINITY_DN12754_c0_g1_i1::g.28718  ORF type:complete len:313 (+),score=25.69,sp/O60662/KLH41_HUMAN/33.33/3e-25,BTB/PF00651.26/5.1e-28,BTB/PF00651.26/1.6e+03,BACK/PF07707.10/7.7e+03,BACK/PF07707.10/7.2e+02,BACK/PF07707.10/3.2e-11,DUF4351/PF14261.1/1.8e+03,DUF4351/PF14261.1/0.53 TRINITY_DN12754_c0_g1_i1:90-1028(+)